MPKQKSFHPYAFITIIFWSLAYVYTKLALQHFSAFPLGFLRYFTSSFTLLLIFLRKPQKVPALKDIPLFFAAGGCGFFLYMITFNQGQACVSSSTASVLIATTPIMTACMASVFYKERLQPYQWASIALCFGGVVLLAVLGNGLALQSGVLWLLAAAFSLSIYNLLQRKLTVRYSALQASSYSIFAGTLLLTIFAPAAFTELASAPPIQYLYLILLGVFASALAYIAWAKAFALASTTSQVSNYMFLTPFFASILGFAAAGEVPDSSTLWGGAFILLGLFFFNFGNRFFSGCSSKRNSKSY